MVAYSPTNLTASATLSNKRHGDGGVTVNAAAGLTLSLPAAKGSGVAFRIYVGTTVTSNNVIVKAAGSDVFKGNISALNTSTNATTGWPATGTMNTLTLNGGTTGGLVGDSFELRDSATGVWVIAGRMSETGTAATPFSTT